MLASMTGFSNITVSLTSSTGTSLMLTCMLKSLNARFIEVNCKLPYALTHLETEIVKRLKISLMRGTLYVTVHINNPQALKADIIPAYQVIAGYVEALKAIQERYELPGTLTLAELIHLPHIFEVPDLLADAETSNQVLHVIDELAQELISVRLKEGALLEEDIRAHMKAVEAHVKMIQEKAVVAAQERREHMSQQLEAVLKDAACELRDQQMQLLQLQLNRQEISEELVRCDAHIAHFFKILDAQGYEKGKKLDFTLQEISREVNTIASKAVRADIANLAIESKVELEKIREQVQNVL